MKSLEYLSKKPTFDTKKYGWALHKPVYKKTLKGMVGIEVELEGSGFGHCSFSKDGASWVTHNDGSLRNGIEYVLSEPIPFDSVPEFANGLFDSLTAGGVKLRDSNRTSLHVHVNVQGMKPSRLCSFIALWGILEDTLVEFCGEYRVGNLFALRLSDSEWAVKEIAKMFRNGDDSRFTNDVRYLAMNVSALNKFRGSLEFRPYRGVSSADEIVTWTEVIKRVYEASLTYDLPTDIPIDMSGLGPRGFFEKVFTDMTELLWTEEAEYQIWNGIRRMQSIIYSLPWENLKDEINMKAIDNPFAFEKPRKTPRGRVDINQMAEELIRPRMNFANPPQQAVWAENRWEIRNGN